MQLYVFNRPPRRTSNVRLYANGVVLAPYDQRRVHLIRDCRSSAQNCEQGKKQSQLKLFLPVGPLEIVGMDIPEPPTYMKAKQSVSRRYDGPIRKAGEDHTEPKY